MIVRGVAARGVAVGVSTYPVFELELFDKTPQPQIFSSEILHIAFHDSFFNK